MPRQAPLGRADDILDAALKLFDEVGFDAARVDDIAAQAGVSKGGVYLYFKSKTAILEALIARDVAPVAAAAAMLADHGRDDPLGTLRLILSTLPQRLDDPRLFAIPRLVIASSNRFPEIAATYQREVISRVQTAIITLVRGAIEKGQMRAADPLVVCRALMGLAIFEALRRHVFKEADAGAHVSVAQLETVLSLFAPESDK